MEAIQSPTTEPEKEPAKRTAGLKLFDFILYPVITNLTVFGISVGATYPPRAAATEITKASSSTAKSANFSRNAATG